MNTIFLCVECEKCREKIKVRINPDTDINDCILKKEILGNNCQNLIYAEIHFDKSHNVISSNINNGQLISIDRGF